MPGYMYVICGILIFAGLYIILKPAVKNIYESSSLDGLGKVLLVCLVVAVIFFFLFHR